MAIEPGQEPVAGEEKPLLAEEPLPPGPGEDIAEKVEELDRRIRAGGSEEVRQADEEADAVEGEPEDEREGAADGELGSDADADADPTSDQGADPEDPEAQD